jgi:hypothetical protein
MCVHVFVWHVHVCLAYACMGMSLVFSVALSPPHPPPPHTHHPSSPLSSLGRGAHVGYVMREALVGTATPDGDILDFNPILGDIRSKAWLLPVNLHGVPLVERVGLLPGPSAACLGASGVDAILGCSWLPSRRVWFLPQELVLAVEEEARLGGPVATGATGATEG